MHKLYEGALVLGDNPHVNNCSKHALDWHMDSCPEVFRTLRAQRFIAGEKFVGKLWVPDDISDDEAFRIADGYFGKMINGGVESGK